MNRLLTFALRALMPALFAIVLAGSAFSQVLLQEDYDSYTPGEFPVGWTLVYNGQGDAYQVVTDEEYYSAPNSFTMLGKPSWSAVAEYVFPSPPAVIAYAACVRVKDGAVTSSIAAVGLWNGSEGAWGNYYCRVGFNDSAIYLNATGVAATQLMLYERNRWYDVLVEYDAMAKTASVWIDGQQKGFDEPLPTGTLGYNALVLMAEHTNVQCYFDDVIVDSPDPLGDYGDAPDSGVFRFPTKYNTSSSRVGAPGVHHLTTVLEMLGTAVSVEAGAEDPADPDGVPNLDNADGNDDGILELNVWPWGAPFGVPQSMVQAKVKITVNPSAPGITRYLNILFDADGDLAWKNTSTSREWLVVNLPIDIPPGTAPEFFVLLGTVPENSITQVDSHNWLRATLSRERIDESSTVYTGGWDGSGVFYYGETEDYDNIPRTGPPDVRFRLECDKDPLFMDHFPPPPPPEVIVSLDKFGTDAHYFTRKFNPWQDTGWVPTPGPIKGFNIIDFAIPGNIENPADMILPLPGFPPVVSQEITPHPPKFNNVLQNFGIKYTFTAEAPAIASWWYGQKTCCVLINHNMPPWVAAMLFFWPPKHIERGDPVPVITESGNDTLAYITFGDDPQTPGVITVARAYDYPPGVPESDFEEVLPIYWITTAEFDPDYETDPLEPLIQTEIIGLQLTGYDDEMLLVEGGVIAEGSLQPFKMPLDCDILLDAYSELTMDVGSDFSIDQVGNTVTINNPNGFSIWGLKGTVIPVECCIATRGNVSLIAFPYWCDPPDGQTVDISDVTNMIDHMFISYTPICCPDEADIAPLIYEGEPDFMVDIADLTAMIDHLFINYPTMPACQ